VTSAAEIRNAPSNWIEGNRLVLPSGHVALIDESDMPTVRQFAWHALRARRTVYVQTHGAPANGRTRSYLHRLLLDAPPELFVDHRNQNGLDNQRSNLRLCTRGQNAANMPANPDGSSGYRGVHLYSNNHSNPWRAELRVKGKRLHLGYFSDPWAAAEAYNDAAQDLWGEFALLNERQP
jgi:hypothetical protein